VSGLFAAGNGIVDVDNPACPGGSTDATLGGDFSGYITLDIVNYCTNWFPDQAEFYLYDAIATVGWAPTATPNTIMADIFYIDRGDSGGTGNISAENAVALEFDGRLDWNEDKTFYGRYYGWEDWLVFGIPPVSFGNIVPPPNGGVAWPAAYVYYGDGREPLGRRYGFRYLQDSTTASTLQSWAIVWRSDLYDNPNIAYDINLCDWALEGGPMGYGLWTADHKLIAAVYDINEKSFQVSGGCPSGVCGSIADLYVFLESQRILVSPNLEFNPGNYLGGWADVTFPSGMGDVNSWPAGASGDPNFFNQAYVEIQHSGQGLASSVGYDATMLNNQFLCSPSLYVEVGNELNRITD
jgi:hypothetical protein